MKKLAGGVGTWTVLTVSTALMTRIAYAASPITLCDPLGNNCQYGNETFYSVAMKVAGFIFWDIAAPLSIIMVLVGGFQLITSSGNPEKVSQGRKTIIYAAIGFVAAMLAGGVVSIVKNFIGAPNS